MDTPTVEFDSFRGNGMSRFKYKLTINRKAVIMEFRSEKYAAVIANLKRLILGRTKKVKIDFVMIESNGHIWNRDYEVCHGYLGKDGIITLVKTMLNEAEKHKLIKTDRGYQIQYNDRPVKIIILEATEQKLIELSKWDEKGRFTFNEEKNLTIEKCIFCIDECQYFRVEGGYQGGISIIYKLSLEEFDNLKKIIISRFT